MLKIRFKCILICKMNAFVCIVLASVSIVTVKTIKRIPVNIPYYQGTGKKDYRENSGETENDENIRTLNIIDVKSNENTVDSNKIINGHMKLTEFILEAAKVLKTFENYDLEETFMILDREVWENMYKGCKSHELADIRGYVTKQLRLLKDEPADTLRQYLDILIDTVSNGDYGDIGDMVNYLNSLYAGEHEKFIEVLLGLVHRRISADVDLEKLLKSAVKSLIFDYYCNLNGVDRHELIKMIKHLWKQITSQIDDYKVGRSINSLQLATPFIYERRNEQMYKKRRYNTVNEKHALNKSNEETEHKVRMRADSKEVTNTIQKLYNATHHKHHSKVLVANKQTHRVRANSDEITNVTESHDSKYLDESLKKKANTEELSWENVKESLSNNDLVVTKRSDVVVGGREILKTVTIDPIKGNAYRTNQMPEPERSMIDALRLKKPLEYRKSNKTIEKLIKIGTLAKEINDIIASDSNPLRSAPGRQDLSSMLGISVLQLIGEFDDMATTTNTVYADGGDGNKDVSISMKAIVG